MATTWTWLLVTTLLCLAHAAAACNKTIITTGSPPRTFAQCQDLPSLGASYAWTFNSASNTIDFAFTEDMQSSTGWVGWGINPTATTMVGTQALAAFRSGTGLVVKEYPVTAANQRGTPLLPGNVSVKYSNFEAATAATVVTIFGTLTLTPGQTVKLNHVWQRGLSVIDLATAQLGPHSLGADNYASATVIDMTTGSATSVSLPHQKLKNTHGIINAVSWGILLPIGVMAARYLRPFASAAPLWFYVHVTCQLTGYILGVVGWGLGLKLQHYAVPINYKHRNLGIAIFALATLQVLAVALRPKKDAKVRPFWNVYHHSVGYAAIILIIINIFEGIHLLQPESKWKRAYIVILVILAVVALVLEVITWIVWFKRRHLPAKRLDGSENGNGHYNGNGNGPYKPDNV